MSISKERMQVLDVFWRLVDGPNAVRHDVALRETARKLGISEQQVLSVVNAEVKPLVRSS